MLLLLLACAPDPADDRSDGPPHTGDSADTEGEPDGDSGGDTRDSGGDTPDSGDDTGAEPLPEGLVVLAGVIPVDADGVRPAQDALLLGDELFGFQPLGTTYPESATVLDESGRWLVPGLVDAHVHLAHSGGTTWTGDPLDANLRANLWHGVTTVVDLGGPPELFALRDRVEAGEVLGPRIVATGPMLTAVGSHPCESWYDDALCTFVTPDDAGAAAAAAWAEGADLLKVALADAAFTDWPTPRLDLDALAAITAAGGPVVAHVDADADAIDAVAAGVTILAHPVFAGPMGDDALAAAESAVGVTTTVGAFAAVGDVLDGAVDYDDPGLILGPGVEEGWRYVAAHPEVLEDGWAEASAEWAAAARANLGAMRGRATLLAGSDAGYYFVAHGVGLHRELRELVALGWTPLDALAAATALPHDALGLPGGRLTPGAPADLLLLGADPSVDVAALDEVVAVIRAGRRYTREEILTVDLSAGVGTPCLDDGDCADGERCDGVEHRCAPACDPPLALVNGCGSEAWCAPADGATATTGVCHPEAPCDLYAQDCAPEGYTPACLPYDADTNGCWYGGPRQVGDSCSWDSAELACAPGLFCSWVDARCYALCDPDGPDSCAPGTRCTLQYADRGVPWFGLCL